MSVSDSGNYPFRKYELKYQQDWQSSHKFSFDPNSSKPKYYILEMFPYPSGNIHMGHLRNYTIGDVVARFKTAQGFNVLHPMGWDAFGLPAENAAIENNSHPAAWTKHNIENMRQQLKSIGLSYDWEQEFATCDANYYKHEQKFFLDFLKNGLAYRKESYVNWDPVDQTVLANEQVIDGRGWRSGAEIERKKLSGWFLRVSNYAEELLTELDNLKDTWPNSVLAMQNKWLGKSQGALIDFEMIARKDKLKIYTTRPETLFGASFCAIAPEHPLALELGQNNKEIADFITDATRNNLSQEMIDKAEKLGIDTGLKIKHPVKEGHELPLFIANFILMEYGTGAVFACPAHDSRDFEFATKYNLPIIPVVKPQEGELTDPLESAYEGDGILYNSEFLDGLDAVAAKALMIERLSKLSIGKEQINYKLRDWGISRQRYWGCPIPIIYCNACGTVPVPESDLPVTLPEDVDFSQSGNPLANHPKWKYVACPKCGKDAQRETDTFDTFFESSWYFLRFCDSQNSEIGFSKEKADKFLPVDQYIGGIEHAVLHLLYARFFTKALRDTGYVSHNEPFNNLLTQGMVTNLSFKDKDGNWNDVSNIIKQDDKYINALSKEQVFPQRVEKMSKSKKNGVSPVEIISGYGADTARLFMLSDSPAEKDLEWSEAGLEGAWKYINKIWRFVNNFQQEYNNYESCNLADYKNNKLLNKVNLSIVNFTADIEKFHFNKAVARIRELSNMILEYKIKNQQDINLIYYAFSVYIQLLYPLTPHFALALWDNLGYQDNLEEKLLPKIDKSLLASETNNIAVQINGKLRATFELAKDADREEQKNAALELSAVKQRISGLAIKKVIVVPGKIVNIVAA